MCRPGIAIVKFVAPKRNGDRPMNKVVQRCFSLMVTATTAIAAGPGLSGIDQNNKWSWAENIGHMNWRDSDGGDGVTVAADHLFGIVWLENAGYMNVGNGNAPYGNTDHTDFGVNILPNGDLDGYAWSENLGWANFGWAAGSANSERARFDGIEMRFRGWVWLENTGWINLDDNVQFVATEQPSTSCTRDCDCYVAAVSDAADMGVPASDLLDICDYHYCDIFDGETEGTCTTCTRRYGNTCGSFGGFVQTSDILCAVAGFGNYCACPNSDVFAAGGVKGPSGIPIGTDDILGIVGAFGGANPFNCAVPLTSTCDTAPPPTPDGCGPAAASDASMADHAGVRRMMRESAAPFTTATLIIEPRQKTVRAGGTIEVDIFASNVSGLVGYEFGLTAITDAKQTARIIDVEINTQRRDYVFNGLNNYPSIDTQLGRIGVVVMDAGVFTEKGQRAYLGTFKFEVPIDTRGSITLQSLTDFVALYSSTSQQKINQVKDTTVIVVQPTARS